MEGITAFDYILLPIYLFLVYKIAGYFLNKHYPAGHPYRPYFINGLKVKIAGSIFIGLVYQYYYGGGDTFNFFYQTSIINSSFISTPDTWFRLITHTADMSNLADARLLADLWWYNDTSSYTTACLGAVLGLFCFTKYLPINVLVACLSFTGMWLMFLTFAKQYPKILKYLAVAILFMPGPVVWGSGLFKDSFCMFAIGSSIYCFYHLFEQREIKLWSVLLLLISLVILALIKSYIIAVLVPVLIIKVLLSYKAKANSLKKKTVFYFGLGLLFLSAVLIVRRVANTFQDIDPTKVLIVMKTQKDYLLEVSLAQNGSAYDIGDFEPSITGILKMTVPAINVSLFRPYLWETHSVVQLLDALQSLALLLGTLYLIFKRNIFKSLRAIVSDPNLIMCLLFSLVFAFIVGVTSYNFGSLSRYKIPCIPFYALFLAILFYHDSHTADTPTDVAENLNEA